MANKKSSPCQVKSRTEEYYYDKKSGLIKEKNAKKVSYCASPIVLPKTSTM